MRWLLGLVLLLVLALAFRLGLLAYVIYTLLGGLLISRWLAKSWTESLVAKRECSQSTAYVGETVTVVITVKNQGKLPILWVLVEDLLPQNAMIFEPPNLKVTGRFVAMLMLKSLGAKTLLYQMQCNRRGYYQLGPTIVETGDLFGLHRRFIVATEPNYLTVYPDIVPLAGYGISSKRPIGEVVVTHRLFEDPTRIAGVREYQAGDSMNRIHWRATARTGVMHSKVYEPSTVAGATILLDFHQDSYQKKDEPYRSELAAIAAASVANALYLAGHQVGLVTNGRDAADRIREHNEAQTARTTRTAARQSARMTPVSTRLLPVIVETRRGPDQFMRILESLARLELTDGLQLPEFVTEVADRLPRDASVLVILPRVTAAAAIALGNIRRQGFAVTVLVNLYDTEDYATAAGLLLAEGVKPRHLIDRESVASVCQQIAMTTV